MKEFVKAHRIEAITALLCTVACLAFVVPEAYKRVNKWQEAQRAAPDPVVEDMPIGPGTVVSRRGKRAMFDGPTKGEAFAFRLEEIRTALHEEGLDPSIKNRYEIQPILARQNQDGKVEPYKLYRSMEGADLSGLDLSGFDMRGMTFQACSFEEANLTGVQLTGSYFKYARLNNVNLSDVDLRGIVFHSAIEGISFRNSNLAGVELRDSMACDFTGADVSGSKITIKGDVETMFKGADLRRATLRVVPHTIYPSNEPRRFRDVDDEPITISPAECYSRIQFDGDTKLEGLKFVGEVNLESPFIVAALDQGASVVQRGSSAFARMSIPLPDSEGDDVESP
jgi:hypothetical protein